MEKEQSKSISSSYELTIKTDSVQWLVKHTQVLMHELGALLQTHFP